MEHKQPKQKVGVIFKTPFFIFFDLRIFISTVLKNIKLYILIIPILYVVGKKGMKNV